MGYSAVLSARVVAALVSGESIMNLGATTTGDETTALSGYVLPDTSPHSLTIPGLDAMASMVYIKNISDQFDGTQNVQVTWTPNGGASAVIVTLPPGAFILLFQNDPGMATGITAISLQGDADGAVCDILLGGGATD